MHILESFYHSELFSLSVMILTAFIISSGFILVFKYGNAQIKVVISIIGTLLGVTFLFIVILARYMRAKFDLYSIIFGVIGAVFLIIGLYLWRRVN